MATREIITWVCDLCGSEEDVHEHTIKVDKREVTKDVCDDCWDFIKDALKDFMVKRRKAA